MYGYTDIHIGCLLVIMLLAGAFGGYLNYLHNFDTQETKDDKNHRKYKYILLGIGAAFLVPAFLKMIAGDLVK